MPIYEYTCHDCNRRVSLLWRSFAEADTRQPVCPRCGGARLTRLISRVAVMRSGSDVADPAELGAGLDEDDPRSLARFMRKMAAEAGEDLDPELDEMIGRLESGEDPESIEASMPDTGGDAGDDFGVM